MKVRLPPVLPTSSPHGLGLDLVVNAMCETETLSVHRQPDYHTH